ncbi:hypothetical protein CBR_g26274 [Chara braunii]|uniref:CCHC-type domain-containing protein n=1 Tax=Chara braunii TaxID=69332 RepID=A0A388L7D7_CHABU|nr:hypothetical protein CBR_g26274 [Chara braunii]|eukprot:GBG78241.1 hypothetical protein CBR_g26274 [Chara braunii]
MVPAGDSRGGPLLDGSPSLSRKKMLERLKAEKEKEVQEMEREIQELAEADTRAAQRTGVVKQVQEMVDDPNTSLEVKNLASLQVLMLDKLDNVKECVDALAASMQLLFQAVRTISFPPPVSQTLVAASTSVSGCTVMGTVPAASSSSQPFNNPVLTVVPSSAPRTSSNSEIPALPSGGNPMPSTADPFSAADDKESEHEQHLAFCEGNTPQHRGRKSEESIPWRQQVQQGQAKGLPKGVKTRSSPPRTSSKPQKGPKISELAWQKRTEAGICLHCQEPNHMAAACPLRREDKAEHSGNFDLNGNPTSRLWPSWRGQKFPDRSSQMPPVIDGAYEFDHIVEHDDDGAAREYCVRFRYQPESVDLWMNRRTLLKFAPKSSIRAYETFLRR